jgi:hypothetical protein
MRRKSDFYPTQIVTRCCFEGTKVSSLEPLPILKEVSDTFHFTRNAPHEVMECVGIGLIKPEDAKPRAHEASYTSYHELSRILHLPRATLQKVEQNPLALWRTGVIDLVTGFGSLL